MKIDWQKEKKKTAELISQKIYLNAASANW